MIKKLKNERYYDMNEADSGVTNDKGRSIGDFMHYVCSCIGGITLSITRVWTRTPKGRRTIVMFYITLS